VLIEKQSVGEKTLYRVLSQPVPNTGNYGSLYIKASSFPSLVDEMLHELRCNKCVQRIRTLVSDKIICREAERYKTGIAIFWHEDGPTHIVLPSFPINEDKLAFGTFNLPILHEILARQYVIGIILVGDHMPWDFFMGIAYQYQKWVQDIYIKNTRKVAVAKRGLPEEPKNREKIFLKGSVLE